MTEAKRIFDRIHLIVMDSVGIGALPDAHDYGDQEAHTLGHIASEMGGLTMPHMAALGLGNIETIQGIQVRKHPEAYYTKMAEASNGKDTMTGHWELMGIITEEPFRVFPNGFPEDMLDIFAKATDRPFIGNKPASGTAILDELGDIHIETGALILYTSADSVIQIAAHESIVPIEELYHICQQIRELTLEEPYKVGRVIARPFTGSPGQFTRTSRRRDYALKPPEPTVLNQLAIANLDVIGIGKINDIYDGEGITQEIRTTSNQDGMNKMIQTAQTDFTGLSFLNLVDFDALYGHRRDPIGYGKALEAFDQALPSLLDQLSEKDLLIITADHGNDPTHHGTDHTREYVPLIIYTSGHINNTKQLPILSTFADIGATIADNFQVNWQGPGISILPLLTDN